MLEITNLHAETAGKQILNGLGQRNNDRIRIRAINNATGETFYSDYTTNWDNL